jgi:hypothetical protein
MCGIIDTFSTKNSNSQNYCHINNAGVCGAIAVGVGFSQKAEFCSALDIPNMSQNKYNKCESAVIDKIEELAHEEMIEAGKEEYNLAIEAGEVDSDGMPYITVIVDGAWSKRSYKSNYNALSGVGCTSIIGARTKKVLYVGVKNKFCKICKIYEKLNERTPSHKCYKNWNGTSTSMEAGIILDGFKNSLDMHHLRE